MTWTQIYNLVAFKIWGNSPVAEGTRAMLQGEYGIIGRAHRKLQEDYNYWFMETTANLALTATVALYDLPTDFKEVEHEGMRLVDVSTGDYMTPMTSLLPGDASINFRSASSEAEYPLWYQIYGGQLEVFPVPSLTGVLVSMRYYAFLPRPPADFTGAPGDAYDMLTREGHDAIVGLSAAEMCKIQEEYQKAAAFEADAAIAIELLKQKDARRRRAEVKECRYVGF